LHHDVAPVQSVDAVPVAAVDREHRLPNESLEELAGID
jgi:hypothetical protein